MSEPRALQYSRFIEILYLMEACVPALPTETGIEFLIFRWGATGYGAKPGGPRAPFIHRANDESVTVLEISKTLRLLKIEAADFWRTADACMINPDQKAAAAQNKPRPNS